MTMTLVPARKVQSGGPSVEKKITAEVLAAQAGEYPLAVWRFSWDKYEATFHLRAGDLNLYIHSIEGYTNIAGSDGESGRLMLEHSLVLDEKGNATFTNAPAEAVVSKDAPVHQMCFARAEHKWRIWRRPDDGLTLQQRNEVVLRTRKIVDGYRGPVYLFWPRNDTGGHVFAKTPFEVVDGLVVFSENRG